MYRLLVFAILPGLQLDEAHGWPVTTPLALWSPEKKWPRVRGDDFTTGKWRNFHPAYKW